MKARHTGLTWDHPRGFNTLAAAEREIAPPGLIHWEKQPLEGFESHPIGDLAARYDILVLDHPHIGEAVALDCLTPLEDVFTAEEIVAWDAGSIGPTMASYRWQGRHWALPLDVATQVAACRADLAGAEPDRWDDVVRLSEAKPVALSLAGPHAVLGFFSLLVALGHEPGGDALFDDAAATEALDILARLARRVPSGTSGLNPIGLLNAMAGSDAIAYVPLVFGYVTYATAPDGGRRVTFLNAPAGPSGRRGSVLGGTGLALTKRSRPDQPLVEHLRWLLGTEAQTRFIPAHQGQPSARAAWQDADVNARSGNFYEATLATTEAAWVRPRHDGTIAFQTEASSLVRRFLIDGGSLPATLATLRTLWHRSREDARGSLSEQG